MTIKLIGLTLFFVLLSSSSCKERASDEQNTAELAGWNSSVLASVRKAEAALPPVLYSWTDQQKLDSMIRQFKGNQTGFFSQVYATRTPLSSYMYGPILVRIKLRAKDLLVRQTPKGDERYFSLPQEQKPIIVHKRQIDGAPIKLLEYVITSFESDVVESISYSTADIQSEMLREKKLIDSDSDYDLALQKSGKPILFDKALPTLDGHACGPEVLEQRFKEIKSQISKGVGKVIYASNVDRKISPHFKSDDLDRQMVSFSFSTED